MPQSFHRKDTQQQFDLDLDVLGIPHAKLSLLISDVAVALQISEQTVRNLLDAGYLVACSKGLGADRNHVTIERWSVIAWKLNQWEQQGVNTAQFTHRIKQLDLVNAWRRVLAGRGFGRYVEPMAAAERAGGKVVLKT